jgi:hypothetical protein
VVDRFTLRDPLYPLVEEIERLNTLPAAAGQERIDFLDARMAQLTRVKQADWVLTTYETLRDHQFSFSLKRPESFAFSVPFPTPLPLTQPCSQPWVGLEIPEYLRAFRQKP